MRELLALVFLFAVCATPVPAAEPVVCSITTAAAAVSTAAPTSGTCTWVAGSTVLVSCDQDIYLDSTTTGITPPVATTILQARLITGTSASDTPASTNNAV